MNAPSDSFPRQYARTQRLTLGEPRTFTVSPDGERIVFVRTASGDDPVNQLWMYNVNTHTEELLLDPRQLGADLSTMTDEEKRRRERAREGAGGIVTYSTDAEVRTIATIVGGALVLLDVEDKSVTLPNVAPGIFDARLSPDGSRVAYIRGRALQVCTRDGNETTIADDTNPDIFWGSAEFIAAEEMGRQRGFWWSPDSKALAATRVDVSPIPLWTIADPAQPETPSQTHRYPAAGTHNALVSLHIISIDSHAHVDVTFPGEWEYLTSVSWTHGGLIGQTQTRDQREVTMYSIDTSTGVCKELLNDVDHAWVELVPGVPTLSSDRQLITCQERDGARRLYVSGDLVTPATMQVRSIVSVGNEVVFIANDVDTPWTHHVMCYSLTERTLSHITPTDFDGVASAVSAAGTTLLRTATLRSTRATFSIHTSTSANAQINSFTEEPLVNPNVTIHTVGRRQIPVAIVMPSNNTGITNDARLPVLFDPYGGPHAQRVLAARSAYLSSQWFADQGFCVVIADNRGTPGKGTVYERAVLHDLAGPVLEDQIEVLDALHELEPRADTSRVAIRGWSFGGYLAALAVLRAPEKFHTAVAGAPVTDWRLYDTHYTERYLRHPGIDDEPYTQTSLIKYARDLQRPLLLIHGLADDNVVAAHTLQLSSALLAAGKDHEVLPLSGVTHMTPQEEVAENLLLHQLRFIRRTLPQR